MPVTEAFYEAAIVPELWKEALNRAGEAWNADGVVVSSYPDCLSGYLNSDRMEEFCTRFVSEGWYKRDIRAVRGLAFVRKGNEIATDLDLFTPDELGQLPFYHDFIGATGFQWFAGALLTDMGASQITLSIHRKAGRDPFLSGDLSRIQRDLPHVKRAARLASKARMSYAEGLVDSLERMTCGAILIDWLGRVIRMNRKAESYIGSDLQVISSRLRSQQRENNKVLQDLIEACTQPLIERHRDSVTSALLHRSSELPLVVHAHPIVRRASDVFQGAAGLLLLSDPGEERGLDTKTIQKMFQLTPSELRISTGLAKGLDTQQIASQHGIGADTVRYHLKSIFAKTSTRHQAQLVSLLSRLSDPPELN
ncbi:DNA-binding CsgD family transcriptional regulator/PAS domain-containing protein [Microvirga lupini]|uniref:DNA-binding CsgD family transcriptional regulator/PAS domain-containing protein n=1 Tax=Microvirga lupini TaxID=420324 RepID=A0A7W4YX14_9HYPH|nr:LuxR C-terminal-related transcriptional regulator [Microvirga lupini]MBB3019581.1 DNA-binding CsgD family transcriptional regulator/PAS domain-containing protein [Microvirga lupini]